MDSEKVVGVVFETLVISWRWKEGKGSGTIGDKMKDTDS